MTIPMVKHSGPMVHGPMVLAPWLPNHQPITNHQSWLILPDSETSSSKLQAPTSKLQTPSFKLQASSSKLQPPSSKPQAPSFKLDPGGQSGWILKFVFEQSTQQDAKRYDSRVPWRSPGSFQWHNLVIQKETSILELHSQRFSPSKRAQVQGFAVGWFSQSVSLFGT